MTFGFHRVFSTPAFQRAPEFFLCVFLDKADAVAYNIKQQT